MAKFSASAVLGLFMLTAFVSAKLLRLGDLEKREKIVVMNMNEFPRDEIAMHMPCEESNMFATKCMVHMAVLNDFPIARTLNR